MIPLKRPSSNFNFEINVKNNKNKVINRNNVFIENKNIKERNNVYSAPHPKISYVKNLNKEDLNQEIGNLIYNKNLRGKTNKLHNRFHSDFNAEEFYEKEKYNEKMREDNIKKLQYQKAMEDLNRYPFFPLINAYSKELIENKNKKQIKNCKERINSAFSSDKEIDKKKVSQNLIKKYKSITLKLQPKIIIKTEIKKEKEK